MTDEKDEKIAKLEKRCKGLREDLDEAYDWIDDGERVIVPILQELGVYTVPLVHFDSLCSEMRRHDVLGIVKEWKKMKEDEDGD